MSVIVTGASGQLGRAVADRLLETLPAREVILVTRDPDSLTEYADRGADVRRGDFDEPGSLAEAFAGGERLLLISTDAVGRRGAQHGAAIDAARAAGVRHVAYTSIVGAAPDNPLPIAQEHLATEQAIRDSGLAYTFLRNSVYAEMQVPAAAQAIASGQVVHNNGDAGIAYVAREDCAAAAAAVLSTGAHENRTYDITGPELVTGEAFAALLTELAGTPVQEVQVDDATTAQGLVAAGLPEPVAQVFAAFGAAARDGYLASRTDGVRELTGSEPRSLRDVISASLTQAATA
ncbi:MAG: hypothetical protein QOD55_2607 [Solirubrobacteraceae bacterium]|jgi:NAD(P)H dehydrogenase (quinone)|nr:hypothetical protein [Solirubrobacteraceae bacterium]